MFFGIVEGLSRVFLMFLKRMRARGAGPFPNQFYRDQSAASDNPPSSAIFSGWLLSWPDRRCWYPSRLTALILGVNLSPRVLRIVSINALRIVRCGHNHCGTSSVKAIISAARGAKYVMQSSVFQIRPALNLDIQRYCIGRAVF